MRDMPRFENKEFLRRITHPSYIHNAGCPGATNAKGSRCFIAPQTRSIHAVNLPIPLQEAEDIIAQFVHHFHA